MHREYWSLERQCRAQAALTGYEKARQELEKMEVEYKAIADSLERQEQEAATHPKNRARAPVWKCCTFATQAFAVCRSVSFDTQGGRPRR